MAFDLLYSYKVEIEDELGISLTWERADKYKASWICCHLYNVSITNEADWTRMAKFHAEWSNKICNAMLPYLMRYMGHSSLESTYYYIHLIPDYFSQYRMLTASSADVIPEVDAYEV